MPVLLEKLQASKSGQCVAAVGVAIGYAKAPSVPSAAWSLAMQHAAAPMGSQEVQSLTKGSLVCQVAGCRRPAVEVDLVAEMRLSKESTLLSLASTLSASAAIDKIALLSASQPRNSGSSKEL